METLTLLAAYALAAVFAVAGISKLFDRAGSRKAVEDFGLPASLAPIGGILLPAAELALAVLLVIPATMLLGGIGSVALLVAFLSAIAFNLAQGRRPDCHCFGQVHSAPIGWPIVVRNVVLLALALLVTIEGRVEPGDAFGWLERLTTGERAISALLAVAVALMALQAWLQWLLYRQARDSAPAAAAAAHSHDLPEPLPVGSPAPDFSVADLDGATVTLQTLLAPGRPVLLLFASPTCGPCEEVMPDVAQWQASHANVVTVAVLSTGGTDENRAKLEQHGLASIYLQRGTEVADAYRYLGTPSAVAIAPDGTIKAPLAAGPDEIRRLFQSLMAEHVEALWQTATGEDLELEAPAVPIGSAIPDAPLTTLEGEDTTLASEIEGKESLLVLWSPTCGFCAEMVDDLNAVTDAWSGERQILFVSDGDPDANRAMGMSARTVLHEGFSVGTAVGATGTPSAIVVDRDGNVASHLMVGADGVLALARDVPADGRPSG